MAGSLDRRCVGGRRLCVDLESGSRVSPDLVINGLSYREPGFTMPNDWLIPWPGLFGHQDP